MDKQETLYVEISRARDRAELVTDDKAALRETLEAVTGERIAALEAVGEDKAKARWSRMRAAGMSRKGWKRRNGPLGRNRRRPRSRKASIVGSASSRLDL